MNGIVESDHLPLENVQLFLESIQFKGMFIGGIASSFLGRPRFTNDIDVVVIASTQDVNSIIKSAEIHNLLPRIDDPAAFARKSRMLLLRDKTSQIDIDISLGLLPFEVEAVERRQTIQFGGISLFIPTPEDMIIMKAVAHRPMDMDDIKGIIANYDQLDKKRIFFWIREFTEALENPEIETDLRLLFR